MTGVKIISLDYAVGKKVISNDDLTKILDTSDEWITSRTGIKQRRILSGNETSADLGIEAAKNTINRVNLNPENIDIIICASSAPEIVYPSISCLIQAEIGAINACCFDIKAACAGFIYSLNTARAFIKSGLYKNILIVSTDATTKFSDWEDRSSCVLFGDGAGAVLVGQCDVDDVLGIDLIADGTCGNYITLKVNGKNCPLVEPVSNETKPFIQMKGKDVYKFVMSRIPSKLEELMEKCNLKPEDIDYFIPHQSNQRMIDALSERLSIEQNKTISNIAQYGNMSAASIIVAIREAIDKKEMKLPATVMLSAFGAGMTAGNAILKLDKKI